MSSDIQSLPGVTLDPKDEAGLETAFGVTSNAEELIRHNRQRTSPEHRKALNRRINHDLSERVQEREEFDPERAAYGAPSSAVEAALEDHVGHPVERAVVRGKGRSATISYSYIGDRNSIEKGIVPFVDVFGTAQQKRSVKRERKAADARDPKAAGERAAAEELEAAEAEAAERLQAAQAEAEDAIRKAREEAEQVLADAHAEAAKIREEAGEKAADAAETAEEKAKKAAAAKGSGSGRSRSRSRAKS